MFLRVDGEVEGGEGDGDCVGDVGMGGMVGILFFFRLLFLPCAFLSVLPSASTFL